jgi:ubiquinone/menaquinone biosynthesis C-methylase UbiE
MKSLDGASEKVGINLKGPYEFSGFKIHKGNANAMDCFEDDRFDVVLCNAMLEHDPYFWKSIAEIKRVTRPGGLVIIGVPGYKRSRLDKMQKSLEKAPVFRRFTDSRFFNILFTATFTFKVHSAPGDYYRFSPQAIKKVFFEGMTNVHVRSIMQPPRLIGIGTKKAS